MKKNYNDIEDIRAYFKQEELKRKKAEEWRETLLTGTLEHELSQSDYEFFLESESKLLEPSVAVVEFCIAGLKQFPQYKDLEDVQVYTAVLYKSTGGAEKSKATPKKLIRIHKKIAIAVIAIITTLLIATATAAAFGYNIFEMIWNAINTTENTSVDSGGNNEVFFTKKSRFYNSMEEMLEIEKMNILYPAKLPDGYSFTDFEVVIFDNNLSIEAFALEPYISFIVRINANIGLDSYLHEVNDIKYNVFDMGGLYQAEWNIGTDYYEIVVSDEAIILEIINNLTGELKQ